MTEEAKEALRLPEEALEELEKMVGPICPLLRSKCIEKRCVFWTLTQGRDPRLGTPVQQYQCALTLQPVIMLAQPPSSSGGRVPFLGG